MSIKIFGIKFGTQSKTPAKANGASYQVITETPTQEPTEVIVAETETPTQEPTETVKVDGNIISGPWGVFELIKEETETLKETETPVEEQTETLNEEQTETYPEILTFAQEMTIEAASLNEDAEEFTSDGDTRLMEAQKIVEAERLEEEALKVALDNYERAQASYDRALKYLEDCEKAAYQQISDARSSKEAMESQARAKIAAMRAARAAGISYADYIEREENLKAKANAASIAKAKEASAKAKEEKAKAQAEYAALVKNFGK